MEAVPFRFDKNSGILVMLLSPNRQRKGGIAVRLPRFLEAVAASVVAYYLCKWLDMLLYGLSN